MDSSGIEPFPQLARSSTRANVRRMRWPEITSKLDIKDLKAKNEFERLLLSYR